MLATIQGIVRGRHIELAQETGWPAGSTVIIDIRSAPLTLTEKRRRVDELCGVWAGDADVNAVFSEIEQARSVALPREADFDVAD